jgi:hypothetical protein
MSAVVSGGHPVSKWSRYFIALRTATAERGQ